MFVRFNLFAQIFSRAFLSPCVDAKVKIKRNKKKPNLQLLEMFEIASLMPRDVQACFDDSIKK